MDEYEIVVASLFDTLDPISRPSRRFSSLDYCLSCSNNFAYDYNTLATIDVSYGDIEGASASFICSPEGEVIHEFAFLHPDPRVDETIQNIHDHSKILVRTINSPIHICHYPGQPPNMDSVFGPLASSNIHDTENNIQLSLFIGEIAKTFDLTAGTTPPWEMGSECPLFSIFVDPVGEMLLLHTAKGVEALKLGPRGLRRLHSLVLRLIGHNIIEAHRIVAESSDAYLFKRDWS